MVLGSFTLFIMIFFFEQEFNMKPETALSTVSLLIFFSIPLNILSSTLSGYIFNRYGRKKPILAGFLISITGCLLVPYAGQTVYPNIYLLVCMIHIGSAWTQNPPLIADYIEPNSIGKAVAV